MPRPIRARAHREPAAPVVDEVARKISRQIKVDRQIATETVD